MKLSDVVWDITLLAIWSFILGTYVVLSVNRSRVNLWIPISLVFIGLNIYNLTQDLPKLGH